MTPRFGKREQKKKKPCCVPGCVVQYDQTCGFASFETVYVACGVISGSGDASPVLLCAQHHRAVHRYCNPSKDVECAICGIKRKHRASTDTSFRPPMHTLRACICRDLHLCASFNKILHLAQS